MSPFAKTLKTPASFVLAALGGSTYPNVRLAPSLAAATLDDRFDHPLPLCPTRRDASTVSCEQIAATTLQKVSYARISVTTPAPTVRPPSRTANRKPCSIAIGAINSPVNVVLSPGITISTPSANCTTPVTSVVRK